MKTLFNELKIGNLIWDFDEHTFYPIEEIKKNAQGNMCVIYRNGSFMSTEPIPTKLTEELLLQFGFEKIGVNFQFNGISIWFSSYSKCYQLRYYLIGSDIERIIILKYVHTLQNFIELTGEELKIINK
jgi:hypothetical protein